MPVCTATKWRRVYMQLIGALWPPGVRMHPSIISISCIGGGLANVRQLIHQVFSGCMHSSEQDSSKYVCFSWLCSRFDLHSSKLSNLQIPLVKLHTQTHTHTHTQVALWPLGGSSYPLTNSISCFDGRKAGCSSDSWTYSTDCVLLRPLCPQLILFKDLWVYYGIFSGFFPPLFELIINL